MDPKKSPSGKLFYGKQGPTPYSIKSLDFRSSLSINSVKSLTSQVNGKMGHFFSPKASLEFKVPIFPHNETSLPKKKPELVSPQLYFISKQKISKPEESKIPNFKGVLSEIYNKDTFKEEKKSSFVEKRPESSEKTLNNNENSNIEKTLGSGRVDLYYRGAILKVIVENPEEKTFSWLKTRLLNELIRSETEKGNKCELNSLPINGFANKDGFYLIDFALHSISDWSLSFLKNKRICLIPLMKEPRVYESLSSRQSLKQYELLKVIGSGGFSQVILGRKRDTRRMYALKIIRRDFIHKNEKESIIMNEINILKSCDNPFIVHLESAFKTRKYLIFVMDFCAGGEFFCLLKRKKRIREDEARLYFIELCLGIDYLHRRSIIYRDIKPENILLDLDGHLKIADFGLAKPHMDESMLAYSFCGSPEYMAPEMLRKNGHNFCVDLYCLGTFLYELVVGIPPFYSTNTKEMFQCILKKNILIPDTINLSPEIKSLLRGLLEKTPEKRLGYRMGVSEIFQHPWCRKANIEAIAHKRIEPPFKPDLFEFYFDEVSNQELLEELVGEFDDNITEIHDEEDYNDQLNEFHYVFIEPKTSKNRPSSGVLLEDNKNNNSSYPLKTQPNEYKSVSSANFEEFLLGMKKSNNDALNKPGVENLKKQISVNLGLNKFSESSTKKLNEPISSATVILQHGHNSNSHTSGNINSHTIRKSMNPESYSNSHNDFKAKNQPLSTKNTTAKHFHFDTKVEGARTYESLDDFPQNHSSKVSQKSHASALNLKTESSTTTNSLKKNNKLFQEIHASINRQLLNKNAYKFQKNTTGSTGTSDEKGFNHVSSSQNLHETLSRLNAKKNENNLMLDLKRKTMSGSKGHYNQNEH